MVFLVIEERLQGSGFGLVTCAYNFALIFMPMLVGYIND